MEFHPIAARPNWKDRANELGYLVEILDDPPYWAEALQQPFCAMLSLDEVENKIEAASASLNELALAVVDRVCCSKDSDRLFDQLKIPQAFRKAIRDSWLREDPCLYGRFDFAVSGSEVKLLELNFDTPTSLYEASVLQWIWNEDLKAPDCHLSGGSRDQFNSIHEKLQEAFAWLATQSKGLMHFAALDEAPEDEETVKYLQSCAALAGIDSQFLYMHELGYDERGKLIDQHGRVIERIFKLYPWEFLMSEDESIYQSTGRRVLPSLLESNVVQFLEPVWKSILSNKAVLPLLWQEAPGHPNLLETAFDDESRLAYKIRSQAHVRKPIFGREGGSVSIVIPEDAERCVHNPSQYGKEGFILQAYHPLPTYGDYHIVMGSWIIGDEPAGIGLRADRSAITGNTAHFIPHYIPAQAIMAVA